MKDSVKVLLAVCTLLVPQAICAGNDSVNVVDGAGKKQGLWKITNSILHKDCYEEDQVVEEGTYKDSRKDGFWMEYYCNKKVKSKISYVNNRPSGHAVIYHENGNVKEEGTWENNRWTGTYKLYYSNGQVQQSFNFNTTTGKREGKQVYYYENGKVMTEGNWAEGKESGEVKEYYETGEVKSVKSYNGGIVDESTVKTFNSKKPVATTAEKIEGVDPPVVVVEKTEKTAVNKPFDGEGYWQLYNSNRQITKDGTFKANRFMEGKAYFYDENGILTRIAIYKDGKYVGDGLVE